ncbi:class I SAM-dependent methyltransferase [Kineosporia sp. R_H_3]|uniref:class I SAM-dependent methyltransferase n=1 Tax=Kineosporia sp. R_H_3 TaxID=1961848 RepID=UPI000B4A7699|nr:SAM-dependent methyltransferase [Kineosporia sp. R_H_3]
MDLSGISALLTSEGWALLESLPPYDEAEAMVLGERLRAAGHPADLVSAALTQSRLRAAGRAKFGPFADGMLFTPTGLEQATRFAVAARHAQRFASAGVERVADLGCGIGADSMALATFDREVLAVERDELTAAVATMNLRHWPEAVVRCEDATTTDLTGIGAAFVDPARRTASGKRVLDPRQGSPTLEFVVGLAGRLAAVGMKTAPGIAHHLVPVGAEAQWVSVGGDVVECALWFGLTAREGVRRAALVLPPDGVPDDAEGVDTADPVEVTDAGMPDPEAGAVGAVLYEPDGAVIRAGLVGQVAALVEGRLVDPTIAYVTSDRVVRTALATAYAVEDVMPFQLKSLRTALRDRGVGRLTIKKRGTAVEPEQLRRQLRLEGDAEATIVLTRVAGRQSVLFVRPLR